MDDWDLASWKGQAWFAGVFDVMGQIVDPSRRQQFERVLSFWEVEYKMYRENSLLRILKKKAVVRFLTFIYPFLMIRKEDTKKILDFFKEYQKVPWGKKNGFTGFQELVDYFKEDPHART